MTSSKFEPVYEEGGCCPQCSYMWLEYQPLYGCTCHMGMPPCSRCVGRLLECGACGWVEGEKVVMDLPEELFKI